MYATAIDRATGEVKKIDLSKDFKDTRLDGAFYQNGKMSIDYNQYGPETFGVVFFAADVDLDTGKITGVQECSDINGKYSFAIGEYRIETGSNIEDDKQTGILTICSPDGQMEKVSIVERGNDIYDISLILPVSDTKHFLLP